jgi:UrcA family protein
VLDSDTLKLTLNGNLLNESSRGCCGPMRPDRHPLIADGTLRVGFAMTVRPLVGWDWFIAADLGDILVGVILLIGWPETALWVTGLLLGVNLIFTGAQYVALALTSRLRAPVAARGVQKKQVGMSYTDIPIKEVSLTRKVGFRDLDLASPSGKVELDKRIKAVAKEVCNQLKTLYPLEQLDTDTRTCIADAVQGAMT